MDIKSFSEFHQKLLPEFDQFLTAKLNDEIKQPLMRESMLYSLNSGGKPAPAYFIIH